MTPKRAARSRRAPTRGQPIAKRFRRGTHRACAPEETAERVRGLFGPMGITRVADVTGLDRIGVPVVMVVRPNARSLAVSQGKGLDLAAARASGIMESIELYHAERIQLPLTLASFDELRFSRPMIDVAGLARVSLGAYHGAARILWIEGRDLLGGGPLWLPFETVHCNFSLPLPPGSGCFLATSCGLASGNHLVEAVSHGICEVVEHDATTLWYAGGAAARRDTRLDLATVDDPDCREVLARFARAGVAVAAWETTSDVGIASFVCEIADRAPGPVGAYGGMGCHPAREIALFRALTEAAQSRLTLISGARDDIRPRHYTRPDPGAPVAPIDALPDGAPGRSFRDVPTFAGRSLDEDVAWELARLRAAGVAQVAMVDLTRREFGVPVARVVIPGLESVHDAPGFTFGARARRKTRAAG